jgi:hypothetical protein
MESIQGSLTRILINPVLAAQSVDQFNGIVTSTKLPEFENERPAGSHLGAFDDPADKRTNLEIEPRIRQSSRLPRFTPTRLGAFMRQISDRVPSIGNAIEEKDLATLTHFMGVGDYLSGTIDGRSSPIDLLISSPDGTGPSGHQADPGPAVPGLLAQLRSQTQVLSDPIQSLPWSNALTDQPIEQADPFSGSRPVRFPDTGSLSDVQTSSIRGSSGFLLTEPQIGSSRQLVGAREGSTGAEIETLAEVASRLTLAAERLEQAALRLAPQIPQPIASAPRPFRGRVDT